MKNSVDIFVLLWFKFHYFIELKEEEFENSFITKNMRFIDTRPYAKYQKSKLNEKGIIEENVDKRQIFSLPLGASTIKIYHPFLHTDFAIVVSFKYLWLALAWA